MIEVVEVIRYFIYTNALGEEVPMAEVRLSGAVGTIYVPKSEVTLVKGKANVS
jgi:hypothetical protein